MKRKSSDLKTRMIRDAVLILSSVSFLEKQILKKTSELDEAINNNLIEEVDQIKKELNSLLFKLNKEDQGMDAFMNKYKKEIENEKKTILFNSK